MIWNIEILAKPQRADADAMALLPLFSRELSKWAARFKESSLRGNVLDAVRACHKMRGSAATFGFTLLADQLLETEILMKNGTIVPSTVSSAMTSIANRIAQFSETSPLTI